MAFSMNWGFGLCAGVSLLLVPGCGRNDGVPRYDVSGQVIWNGQPAPAGTVVFTPDREKGNAGPQGAAKIMNGRYDTRLGRGTVGGPHKVFVIVTEEGARAEDAEVVSALAEHTFEVDLPKATTEHDLVIAGRSE